VLNWRCARRSAGGGKLGSVTARGQLCTGRRATARVPGIVACPPLYAIQATCALQLGTAQLDGRLKSSCGFPGGSMQRVRGAEAPHVSHHAPGAVAHKGHLVADRAVEVLLARALHHLPASAACSCTQARTRLPVVVLRRAWHVRAGTQRSDPTACIGPPATRAASRDRAAPAPLGAAGPGGRLGGGPAQSSRPAGGWTAGRPAAHAQVGRCGDRQQDVNRPGSKQQAGRGPDGGRAGGARAGRALRGQATGW